MSQSAQAKSPKRLIPPLDPKQVRVALAIKGWTQAMLAQRCGKSLTTINLAINHNTFPEVTSSIRKILSL